MSARRGPRPAVPSGAVGAFALLLAMLAPLRVAAATVGPGGVAGATLWFAASDYTGTTWPDRSGSGAVTSAAAAPSGGASPSQVGVDANYNPGVGFDGSTQSLQGTLSSSSFASANSYMFAVSNSSVYAPSATTWGDVLSGYSGPGQGIEYSGGTYGADLNNSFGPGPFTIPSAATVLSDVYYATAGSGVNATAAENGVSVSASQTYGVTAATQFEIGARTTGGFTGRLFSGTIDEIIYFKNAVLSAAKISQIRSYLAVKYGITLGYNTQTATATPTDYVNSSGTTVWPSSTNSAYHHNVFGIARDDASGLSQLVSNSSTLAQSGSSFSMTVANGSSATSPSAFATDQTYLMMGDNGLSTTMSNHSGIFRMDRVWIGQLSKPTTQVYFQMPASAFTGVTHPAIWVWSGSLSSTPIYNQLLTCNASICYVVVPATASGAYYFSFGQLQISGTVFEDPNYGGGSGRPQSTSGCGCAGLSGVRVELYAAGVFNASTTTGSNGSYLFLVNPSTTYVVRVVTPTASSRTGGSTTGIVAVQTYRTTASSGTAAAVTDHVGGETPGVADAAANASNASLASLTTSTTAAQSITTVAVPALAGVLGLDFGFNFDTIVNANAAGQGSLQQFIVNANALGGVSSLSQTGQTAGTQTSIFMIGNGSAHNGLHAGANLLTSGVAAISVTAALPAISNASTVIDGTTETANDSNTNSGTFGTGGSVGTDAVALTTESRPTVQLIGTSSLSAGLSIAASSVTVRGVAISGFAVGGTTTTGDIVISGSGVTGTLIEKNVIGTTATAFSAAGGSGGNGVVANGSGGGTLQNNIIGYTLGSPVVLSSTSGWTVTENEIRGSQGSTQYSGIRVVSTTGSTVSDNLIAGNAAAGIRTTGTTSGLTCTDNTLSGNGIGIAGSAPTASAAIWLADSGTVVSNNIISANYGAGILVANGSSTDQLTRNSIFSNGSVTAANGAAASGEIGIDLQGASDAAGVGTAPYITPNRSGGTGTGGNSLYDFPVLDGAAISGTNLILTGYARPGATIEIFIADAAPASGFPQGKTYVTTLTEGATSGTPDTDATTGTYLNPGGRTNIGTDTTNRFRFSLAVPGGVSVGSVLTATEYSAAYGTSEFGPDITVGNGSLAPSIVTVLSVSPSASAVPGTTLTYTGAFTNSGQAQAGSVAFVDPVPSSTDFQIGSAAIALADPNLTGSISYSADNGTTWTYTPVSGGGGAAAGYDRNVTRVRFTLSGWLSFNSPYNTGSFSLAVKIQ